MVVNARDDLNDDSTQDALARLRRCRPMVPCTLEVCTECQKLRAFRLAQRWPLSHLHLLELSLEFADCQQPFIPPTLQLGRNDPVAATIRFADPPDRTVVGLDCSR